MIIKKLCIEFLLILFLLFFCFSCKKKDISNECAVPTIVPFQPYSDPVWHPNGQLFGFNHTPQVGVYVNGTPPCTWQTNSVNQDSAGFYLMNKDGTGFRRVTNFYLNTPAWSPDGNWIAFSVAPNIYKMQFDGNAFDTTHIIQLTDGGANFYPSWTTNSDTIYYDSNAGTNGQGYYIWKMASDGSGKVGFPNTGREPYVASDNNIYYSGLYGEIYSMNKDGTNKARMTFNANEKTGKTLPKYYNGNVYFQQRGIWTLNGQADVELASPAISYDISKSGEVIFGKWDYSVSIKDLQKGTIWIMKADGSNKRQLTFNNF